MWSLVRLKNERNTKTEALRDCAAAVVAAAQRYTQFAQDGAGAAAAPGDVTLPTPADSDGGPNWPGAMHGMAAANVEWLRASLDHQAAQHEQALDALEDTRRKEIVEAASAARHEAANEAAAAAAALAARLADAVRAPCFGCCADESSSLTALWCEKLQELSLAQHNDAAEASSAAERVALVAAHHAELAAVREQSKRCVHEGQTVDADLVLTCRGVVFVQGSGGETQGSRRCPRPARCKVECGTRTADASQRGTFCCVG